MDFPTWMSAIQTRTEAALDRFLPPADRHPIKLHQAMRYASLGGGKRVRPLLCHGSGSMFSMEPGALDPLACAVEIIHAYSLVHDDLPSMDNDSLRRGKPTCHVKFGEATALLVGDALQSLAFQVIARPIEGVLATRQLSMVALLAEASGASGMAGGQAIDLGSVGKSLEIVELEFMHSQKTGKLIQAAVLLGAHAGGATDSDIQHLIHFSNRIGLLFQVIDDILDAEASTDALGKTAGKDAANGKPTYVSLIGVKEARSLALRLQGEAHDALNSFGSSSMRLHQLTDYIVDRKS